MATKPNGKSPITSDSDDNIIFFRDVSPGPHETQLRFRLIHFWEAWNPLKKTLIGIEMLLIDEQLRFRLIHFWEAWNPLKKTLIGIEMLLIDEQETVIQCFISPGRIERYLPKMKPGSVYKLNNFYGSRNKSVYRVSDHAVTVSFSWNSELSVLEDSPTHFDEDRFRFHSFEDFQASCDRKGDLYDVVGHKKLVNGQSFIGTPVLDEVEIARARHVLVHVQSHDGPVMKLYLWDQAAKEFCKKIKSYENTPTVLLVATVNTKSLGGTLALTSMSSSLFFYGLRCPTYDRLLRLDRNIEAMENPPPAPLCKLEIVRRKRRKLVVVMVVWRLVLEVHHNTRRLMDIEDHRPGKSTLLKGKSKRKDGRGITPITKQRIEKDLSPLEIVTVFAFHCISGDKEGVQGAGDKVASMNKGGNAENIFFCQTCFSPDKATRAATRLEFPVRVDSVYLDTNHDPGKTIFGSATGGSPWFN
ncbi:unnamed protein product [Brassica oleracea]